MKKFIHLEARKLVQSQSKQLNRRKKETFDHYLGSVYSRECLDAPAILATFMAGRTGLVIV